MAKIIEMPQPQVTPTEKIPVPEDEYLTEAQRLAREVQRLEQERTERVGAKLGQVGRPTIGSQSGPPPKKSAKVNIQDKQVTKNALSSIFSQMISVGYRPSENALRDSKNQAVAGSVAYSQTWLANLFIRLLKRRNLVA